MFRVLLLWFRRIKSKNKQILVIFLYFSGIYYSKPSKHTCSFTKRRECVLNSFKLEQRIVNFMICSCGHNQLVTSTTTPLLAKHLMGHHLSLKGGGSLQGLKGNSKGTSRRLKKGYKKGKEMEQLKGAWKKSSLPRFGGKFRTIPFSLFSLL